MLSETAFFNLKIATPGRFYFSRFTDEETENQRKFHSRQKCGQCMPSVGFAYAKFSMIM